LKLKESIWNLTQSQKDQCDSLIKKMVLNAREKDHVAHVYDLVRQLLDILRDVYKCYNIKLNNR
jgi:hypothetical protein